MVIYTLSSKIQHLSTEITLVSPRHPETIKSDGTWRQITVIRTLSAIQRRSSPMAREDKSWSSVPFLLSRDDQVWWHAETIIVICTFVEDPTSIDRDYFSLSFSSTRGKRARWHAETIIVICTLVEKPIESPLTRRDQCGHLPFSLKTQRLSAETTLVSFFLLSRDNRIRWHAKTVMVTRFRCYESIKVPLSYRDKHVRWYAGTMMVIHF